MISTRFLAKLDVETLIRISEAQVDELIERRGVRDTEMFKGCFDAAAPEDDIARIRDFSEIAGKAFDAYHKERAIEEAVVEEVEAELANEDPDDKEPQEPENGETEEQA